MNKLCPGIVCCFIPTHDVEGWARNLFRYTEYLGECFYERRLPPGQVQVTLGEVHVDDYNESGVDSLDDLETKLCSLGHGGIKFIEFRALVRKLFCSRHRRCNRNRCTQFDLHGTVY